MTESVPRRTASCEPQITRLKMSRPKSSPTKRTSPTTAFGERAKRRANATARSSVSRSTRGSARSGVADTGIEPRIDQVHRQIRREVDRRAEEHGPLDDREVAVEDGLDREPPDAGPAEDVLDDERAAEQGSELQADERRDRDERVLQRVPQDDGALAEPLRARRAQVLLAEDLEHARP